MNSTWTGPEAWQVYLYAVALVVGAVVTVVHSIVKLKGMQSQVDACVTKLDCSKCHAAATADLAQTKEQVALVRQRLDGIDASIGRLEQSIEAHFRELQSQIVAVLQQRRPLDRQLTPFPGPREEE